MSRRILFITMLLLPLTVGMVVWFNQVDVAPTASLDPDSAAPVAEREEPLDWGVYQIYWGRNYDRILRDEIEQFASRPRYVMFYRDLERPFPTHGIDAIHNIGATPMISLELWTWGDRSGTSYLAAINAGKYDAYFRKWAEAAKADSRRVLLRFGFEMNGEWFSWSQDPKAFIVTWRRAHTIFQKVGASNVEWTWSPNVVSIPRGDDNDMHLYYPGAAYVDWVSLDGYNFGDHHSEWHRWQSFAEIYDAPIEALLHRYPTKPIIISEFGSAPGKPGQRDEWIRAAYRRMTEIPQIKGAIWFNLDKRREGEPNWRIDESAESLKAFNETFARPHAEVGDVDASSTKTTVTPKKPSD